MAFDANGQWQAENPDVAGRVNGLVQQDSPLMQQAQAAGLKLAAARGLGNSSIAVGASQDAALKSAVPIATADGANATQLDATKMNTDTSQTIAAGQEQTQRDINTQNVGSAQQIATGQEQTQKDISGQQIAGQKDIAGGQEQTQRDINTQNTGSAQQIATGQEQSQQNISAADIASRQGLQTQQLDAATKTQATDIAAKQALQTQQLGSTATLTQEQLDAQQKIANMNVSANDRQRASEAAASVEATYANGFAALSNNQNIPANVRDQYLSNLQAVRSSSYGLLEQIYGIQLNWSNPDGSAGKLPTPGAPAGPATYTPPVGLYGGGLSSQDVSSGNISTNNQGG